MSSSPEAMSGGWAIPPLVDLCQPVACAGGWAVPALAATDDDVGTLAAVADTHPALSPCHSMPGASPCTPSALVLMRSPTAQQEQRGRRPGQCGSHPLRAYLRSCASTAMALTQALTPRTPRIRSRGIVEPLSWAESMLMEFGKRTETASVLHLVSSKLRSPHELPKSGSKAASTQKTWRKLTDSMLGPPGPGQLVALGITAQTDKLGVSSSSHLAAKMRLLGALTFFALMSFVASAFTHIMGDLESGKLEPIVLLNVLVTDSTPLPMSFKSGQSADSNKSRICSRMFD